MNLKQRFDELDANIKLSDAVRQEAQKVHNRLGDLLVEADIAKRTRLQGSFARHTMLGPKLRDIDKVVELDDKWWDDLRGAGGPQKAVALVHDTLAPHLPGARFEARSTPSPSRSPETDSTSTLYRPSTPRTAPTGSTSPTPRTTDGSRPTRTS